jgi:hypothetical protein
LFLIKKYKTSSDEKFLLNRKSWGTGWGTDEKALIEILGHRTAAQRGEIAVAYEGLYDETLLSRLQAELSSHFKVITMHLRLRCDLVSF